MIHQSRPEIKNKKITTLSFLLLILAVVLFSFAPKSLLYITALLQFSAIVCATISLFMITKYVIYDYLYTLEDGNLTIHKINKSKSICVCDIALYNALHIPMFLDEYKTYLKENGPCRIYSYIKNPGCKDLKYVPFEAHGERFTLLIEPEDKFLENLINEIQNKQFTEEDNDD